MHPSQLLLALGLATSASAIDMILRQRANCEDGGRNECLNLNPDTCCYSPFLQGESFASIGVWGIPTDWHLQIRGHGAWRCDAWKDTGYARNQNYLCMVNGPYSGGGYGFVGRRRASTVAPESQACPVEVEVEEGEGGCTHSHEVDRITFEDGSSFDMGGLSLEQKRELSLAWAAGGPAPSSFDLYKRR